MLRQCEIITVEDKLSFNEMICNLDSQFIVAVDSETNGKEALRLWNNSYAMESELIRVEERYQRWKKVHKERYKNRKAAWTYDKREEADLNLKHLNMLYKAELHAAGKNPGGLNFWENSVGCIQIGTDHMHNKGVSTGYLIRPEVMDFVWFEEFLNSRKGIIFHNGKFDLKMFTYHFNIDLHCENFIDTQAGEYVLTLGTKKRIGLKACLKKYCEVETDKQVRMENWHGEWSEGMKQYAAMDVWYLHDIMRKQNDKLPDKNAECLTLEEDLIGPLAQMELNGVGIDLDLARYAADKEEAIRDRAIESVKELFPEVENPLSPAQLLKALKGRGHKIKGTSKKVLQKLPEGETILQMRESHKVFSTYYKPLRDGAVETESGYKVFGNFNSLNAAGRPGEPAPDTGRLSSSEPNLQNQPASTTIKMDNSTVPLRALFIPEPGFKFIVADLDQIEPRILTHISKDEILCDAFEKGLDPYLMMASRKGKGDIEELMEMYESEDPLEKGKAKILRDPEKIALLSVIYGKTPWGLAKEMGCEISQAIRFLNTFFTDHIGIKRFMAVTIAKAKKNGYVDTLGGRRRYIPKIHDGEKWEREHYERAAVNTVIQGTAADGMKRTLILIHNRIKKEGLKKVMKLNLTVHDELVMSTKDSPITIKQGIEIMEWGMKKGTGDLIPSVPVTCKAKVISNWGEGK